MLLHGSRVMESVKPILASEARTEDVKEQVRRDYVSMCTSLYLVSKR